MSTRRSASPTPPKRSRARVSQATHEHDALAATRREIGAIDARLLRLLRTRAAAVSRLPRTKSMTTPWRPAREATHLAALQAAAQRGTDVPPLSETRVENIWRAIFNDSVHTQHPLSISTTHGLESRARRHFGFSAEVSVHTSPARALASSATSPHEAWRLALIPLVDWPLLLLPKFAQMSIHLVLLPDARAGERIAAFAAAAFAPEASGRDLSFLAVRGSACNRLARGHALVPGAALPPQLEAERLRALLARGRSCRADGFLWRLIALDGDAKGVLSHTTFADSPEVRTLGVSPYPRGLKL